MLFQTLLIQFLRRASSATASSEAAGDVRLSARIGGRRKQLRRRAEFDEFAEQHERGRIAYARGLLHVVRHDHDGAIFLQLNEQLFDLRRAYRIKRGTRFVEQKHFGIHRQRTRDAEPLLLAAGKSVGRAMQPVFYFIPQRRAPQTFFHVIAQRSLVSVDAKSVRNVVENRFRKRIRPLENHADAAAEARDILRKNIFAVEKYLPLEPRVAQRLVHAVERAQQGGFAASGRTDQRGDAVRCDLSRLTW